MKSADRFFSGPCSAVIVATGCVLGWASIGRGDDVIPKAFTPDRYAMMAARSPFTPPTEQPKAAPTPAPPPTPSFAEKLTVTSLVESNNVYYATVLDPDSPRHLYLSSSEEDLDTHLRIENVKWPAVSHDDQPAVRESPIITLRQGAQSAQVRYEPSGAGVAGAAPLGGAPGGGPRSFIPGNAGLRPPGVNPIIPGSMPGNVATAPPQMPGVPPVNAARRTTPIRSFPTPAAPAASARRPVLPGGTTTQAARPGATNADDDDDDDD